MKSYLSSYRSSLTPKFILLLFLFLGALTSTGCSSLLYYPTKVQYVDRQRLQIQPEDIFFQSSDGTPLHGWMFRDVKRPTKGTILFFHGNAQNLTAHFMFLYWIVAQGYDLFVFDYRGYGQSGGKPDPEGTTADGRAALLWIDAHRPKDKPLIIFGQSLGGAIALRVAGEMAGQIPFDAVVVDSTFHSYREAGRKILARGWLTWPFQFLPYLILSDGFAPRDYIDKISPRPLLVVHGPHDQTVAFSLGQEVFRLAKDPKEFWEIKDGQHTDFMFRENMKYQKELINWLEKHARPKESAMFPVMDGQNAPPQRICNVD